MPTQTGTGARAIVPYLFQLAIFAFTQYIIQNVAGANEIVAEVKSNCDPNISVFRNAAKCWCIAKAAFYVSVPGLLSHTFPFFTYFNLIIIPVYFMFVLETYRLRPSPLLISSPMLVGLATLAFIAASVIPLFSVALLLGGFARTQPPPKKDGFREFSVYRRDAEAILFGFVIGYAIPTYTMTMNPTTEIYTWWFWFHIYMALFRWLYLKVMPRTEEVDTVVVKTTWILFTGVAALWHWYSWTTKDIVTLLWPPQEALLGLKTAEWERAVFVWDLWIVLASLVCLSFSMVERKRWGALLVWTVTAIPLLGGGAWFGGFMLWREMKLSSRTEAKGLMHKD